MTSLRFVLIIDETEVVLDDKSEIVPYSTVYVNVAAPCVGAVQLAVKPALVIALAAVLVGARGKVGTIVVAPKTVADALFCAFARKV